MHIGQNFLTQLGYGEQLTKTTFRAKINRGYGLGEHPKMWDLLFISAAIEASNFKFGTQFGLGPKLAGVRAREASKKFGTPAYFCSH